MYIMTLDCNLIKIENVLGFDIGYICKKEENYFKENINFF